MGLSGTRTINRWPAAAAFLIGALVIGGAFFVYQRNQPVVVANPSPTPTSQPSPSVNAVVPPPSSIPAEPSPATTASGFWVATGSMDRPLSGLDAVRLLDGRVLVVSGAGGESDPSSAALYDPDSATWSSTGTMARGGDGARWSSIPPTLLPDGKVIAGDELYDPDAGTWSDFQIIAHLAEGTTGVADPEVVDPTGHDCVDAGNNYRHGGGAPAPDDVPYLGFHDLSSLLLGGHLNCVSVLLPFMHAAQIKPEEPEGFALQRVDHFGLLAVELDPQGFQLLLQTLQGTFGPAPLAPVPADGDHHIIREAVIVDRLIGPFRRLAAKVIEVPVHLVQVDVRGQRAEGTALRHAFLSTSFDDQLDEVQDFRVLHPRAILPRSTSCRTLSKYLARSTSMTVVILRIRLRLTSARARCGDRLGRNP